MTGVREAADTAARESLFPAERLIDLGVEIDMPLFDPARSVTGGDGDAHYIHPTDPKKMWCGAARNPGPITDPGPRTENPTCIVCIDLRAIYGISGWISLRDGTSS